MRRKCTEKLCQLQMMNKKKDKLTLHRKPNLQIKTKKSSTNATGATLPKKNKKRNNSQIRRPKLFFKKTTKESKTQF